MKYVLTALVFVTMIIGCKNKSNEFVKTPSSNISENKEFITDSLIYGIVTNVNANIDPYENENFKSFLQDKLINAIFEKLYTGKLKAYDFMSDKKLSINEIKSIEKANGFDRNKVGKVQFNEQWYFDKNGVLNKRVNSMTFGIESYSNQGNFTGYDALFTVKF